MNAGLLKTNWQIKSYNTYLIIISYKSTWMNGWTIQMIWVGTPHESKRHQMVSCGVWSCRVWCRDTGSRYFWSHGFWCGIAGLKGYVFGDLSWGICHVPWAGAWEQWVSSAWFRWFLRYFCEHYEVFGHIVPLTEISTFLWVYSTSNYVNRLAMIILTLHFLLVQLFILS